MSLTAGWNIARSALSVTAGQTAVITRNVANAGDPLAARKNANVVTAIGGGVRLASITPSANKALFETLLSASSDSSGKQIMADALERLDVTVNDPELDASPAALVGRLSDALQLYAGRPHDPVGAQAVLSAAQTLTGALNDGSQLLLDIRREADSGLRGAATRIDAQLAKFAKVNTEIVSGTRSGTDVTDALGTRDAILAGLAEDIGIRTMARADNDLVIYTDSGVTLFETTARDVVFSSEPNMLPGAPGNAFYVDGVAIAGEGAAMPIAAGRIAGLMAVRDDIAPAYQRQLDEIARGLIDAFAETDQSQSPVLPDRPGLFTYPGAPALPAAGALVDGLAASIEVNANADPARGGDSSRLRDGAISDPGNPAYVYNASGAAGYAGRILGLIDALGDARAFDPASGFASSATIGEAASTSVGWLQETRKTAQEDADYRATLVQRTTDSLSRATGINLDEEMTALLDLERSYQASSRLISTIDNMFGALLAATG